MYNDEIGQSLMGYEMEQAVIAANHLDNEALAQAGREAQYLNGRAPSVTEDGEFGCYNPVTWNHLTPVLH